MLSRARKFDDLWLVDLPAREYFEKFLCENNVRLVERVRAFEQQSKADQADAAKYIQQLGWLDNPYVQSRVHRSAPPAQRRRIRGKHPEGAAQW